MLIIRERTAFALKINSTSILFLTCLLLASDRDASVRTAYADCVLRLNPEAVSLSLQQTSDMSMVVADCLEGDPVSLAIFLVLHNETGDFTSTGTVRPLPCQPHLCLICVCVVQVLGWARGILKVWRKQQLIAGYWYTIDIPVAEHFSEFRSGSRVKLYT